MGNSIGEVGEYSTKMAWRYASMISSLTLLLTISVQVPLFMFMEEISELFMSDPEVQNLLLQVMPIVFICFFFEAFQCQQQGVIRGLGL